MSGAVDESRSVSVRGSPRRGLIAATFGFFIGFAGVVVYGPAADQFEEALGLSGVLLGLLVGAPNLIGAVLRVPFGAWTDDVGAKRPFLLLLGLSAIGMAGLSGVLFVHGVEGLHAGLYPLIFLFGALSGCGIAAFSVGSAQTSYWYPAHKQGTALAVYAGLGNSSPAVFTLILPVLIGAIGLTGTYLLWLVILLGGILVYAVVAVDPYYFQLRRQGLDVASAQSRAKELGEELFPQGNTWDSIREAAGLHRTWALVALYFVSLGGFLALTVWFPSYWTSFHDIDTRTAGVITAVGFILVSTIIRIPGGRLSDWAGGERIAIMSFTVVSGAALVLMTAQSLPVAIAGMVLLAVGIGVANAAVFQLLPLYVPEAVGGASGIVSGIGGLGGFVIPPLLGLFVDLYGPSGFAMGFSIYLVLGLASVALAAALYMRIDHTQLAGETAAS